MHAPAVIRLTEYRHIPFERRSLSRKNILLRDHSCCQYCGKQFAPSELTLDHVVPRSRGGESAWTIWLPPVNAVITVRAIARRKNRGCICCGGQGDSRCTLIDRSCAISAAADETWRKYLFYESDGGSDLCVRA